MLVELQPRQILFHCQSSSKGELELPVEQEAVQSRYSVNNLPRSCHCSSKATVEREVQQLVIAWESKCQGNSPDLVL